LVRPTVLGWHERVQAASAPTPGTRSAATRPRPRPWSGKGRAYSRLQHSFGYIPEIPTAAGPVYNMQEVGVDMALHGLEWTATSPTPRSSSSRSPPSSTGRSDSSIRRRRAVPELAQHLDLRRPFLQRRRLQPGQRVQLPGQSHDTRIATASAAIQRRQGAGREDPLRLSTGSLAGGPRVMAEYVDTVGNRLVHPSPELATIYHSIEADLVDPFQAYQLLRFTRTDLRTSAPCRGGGSSGRRTGTLRTTRAAVYTRRRTCTWPGHIYQCGRRSGGTTWLRAVTDAHFLSRYPGWWPTA